jgi:hypothetical protein
LINRFATLNWIASSRRRIFASKCGAPQGMRGGNLMRNSTNQCNIVMQLQNPPIAQTAGVSAGLWRGHPDEQVFLQSPLFFLVMAELAVLLALHCPDQVGF